MAIYKNVNVTITSLGAGQFQFQVGPEGFVLDADILREFVKATRKEFSFLLFQIALNLDAQGIDPATQTPAQLKALIEAMTLKW
jgi:hypothetical protein